MWVVMSSDGQMSKAEMMKELNELSIYPLLVYEKAGRTTVPLFPTLGLALAFAKQNTHRTWPIATMEIDDDVREKLDQENLATEVLTRPSRRNTSVHVLYTDHEVVTHSYGNRSTVMKGL